MYTLTPSTQSLPSALTILCEVVSPEPEGGAARISVELFHSLYSFLADIDGEISKNQISSVMTFLNTES